MKATLLIADRDPALREMYAQFFSRYGYVVETAAGGLDCLARLRRGPVAALVLDRELPWGGGDGVVAWLRDELDARDTPVIVLTSDDSEWDEPHLLAPPVVACFRRPCSGMVLLDRIETELAAAEAAGGS